jgi:hypothetical protein
MSEQLNLIEATVLELATDLARLKSAVRKAEQRRFAYEKLLSNLKHLLEEKGLIDDESVATVTKDEDMIREAKDDDPYNYDDLSLRSH